MSKIESRRAKENAERLADKAASDPGMKQISDISTGTCEPEEILAPRGGIVPDINYIQHEDC